MRSSIWSVRSSRLAFTSSAISLPTRTPKRTRAARKTITKMVVPIHPPVGESAGGVIMNLLNHGSNLFQQASAYARLLEQIATLLRFAFFYFFSDLWQDGERVPNDSQVSDGENGCVLVFVDGDNVFRTLHTRQVLDGTTDANSDIERWFDCFTSLPNLIAVREPASINNSASRAGSAAEGRCEFLDKVVILRFAEAAPATYDDGCLFQCRAFGWNLDVFKNFDALRRRVERDVQRLNLCCASLVLYNAESLWARQHNTGAGLRMRRGYNGLSTPGNDD